MSGKQPARAMSVDSNDEDAQAQADELWQQEKLYYENRLETLCASAVYAAVRGAAGVEA